MRVTDKDEGEDKQQKTHDYTVVVNFKHVLFGENEIETHSHAVKYVVILPPRSSRPFVRGAPEHPQADPQTETEGEERDGEQDSPPLPGRTRRSVTPDLHGCTLEVKKGELVAVVGAVGSGKSR